MLNRGNFKKFENSITTFSANYKSQYHQEIFLSQLNVKEIVKLFLKVCKSIKYFVFKNHHQNPLPIPNNHQVHPPNNFPQILNNC